MSVFGAVDFLCATPKLAAVNTPLAPSHQRLGTTPESCQPDPPTAARRTNRAGGESIPGTCAALISPTGSQGPEHDVALSNKEWVTSLSSVGTVREEACARLYTYLLRASRSEFNRRSDRGKLDGAEREDLAHQAAADALVSLMRRLPDFRGDSMFLTWARSFVSFEVGTKIRLHERRRARFMPVADGDERWGTSEGPAGMAEAMDLKDAVSAAMDAVLTDRQRTAFRGLVVEGSTVDEVACALGANRNAVYQLIFYARRNIRRALSDSGYLSDVASAG